MKNNRITDYVITREVLLFEQQLYKLFDNTPKKFKYDLVQQTKDTLGNAVELLVKSIMTPPYDDLIKYKRNMLVESESYMHVVEVRLSQLNDLLGISTEAKAKLDMSLYSIYGNYSRFVNSLNRRLCGSDTVSHDCGTGSDFIGMPNCVQKGESDA